MLVRLPWLFGPSYSVFSHLNTEIEGRFGILEPIRSLGGRSGILWTIRWPFRYLFSGQFGGSLADSVAVSVFSVRFGILTSYAVRTGDMDRNRLEMDRVHFEVVSVHF